MKDVARLGDHEFDRHSTEKIQNPVDALSIQTDHHVSLICFDRPLDVGWVNRSGSLGFAVRRNDRKWIALVVFGRNGGIRVEQHSKP